MTRPSLYSILYVDDDTDLLDLGRTFLEMDGSFVVDTATSATEALERLETTKFDAIVSDYQMPDMDGIEFLREFRSRYPEIPFILMTGKGREAVVIAAINNGADFYLQKGGDAIAQFAELVHKIHIAIERRSAIRGLMESEQRLADIINFLPDATFATDSTGCVIAWNRAIEEMTGIPAADMIGRGDHEYSLPFFGERRKMLSDLVLNNDEEILSGMYKLIKREGTTLIAETSAAKPRGIPRILHSRASLLYNREGKIAGAIESIRDITDTKRAEEELFSSRQMLQLVLDTIPVRVFWKDRNSVFLGANRALALDAGFADPSECIGKSDYEDSAPDAEAFRADDVHVMETGESKLNYEETRMLPDGSRAWLRTNKVPLRNQADDIIGVLVTYDDITKSKHTEENLRNAYEQLSASEEKLRSQYNELVSSQAALMSSEEKFRDIVETSPDIVWEMDLDGVFTYLSPQSCRLIGYEPEEITGRTVFSLIPEESLPPFRAIYEGSVHRRTPLKAFETPIRAGDGRVLIMEIRAALIRDRAGNPRGFRGLARDITERLRAEEELRLLKIPGDQAN